MARVLVLYGTTDGHTGKVAARLADMLGARSLEVTVANARNQDPHPGAYDGVIVCASLHAGGYQACVQDWVKRHAAELEGKTTAFVTVCLGVLQPEVAVHHELERLRARFLAATGWQPTVVKFVAGALLYREYNWLKRLVMLRIVRKAGGDTDTSRNYEYTDWLDLDAFATEFAWRLQAAHCVAAGVAVA